jgi:hypothetical protein
MRWRRELDVHELVHDDDDDDDDGVELVKGWTPDDPGKPFLEQRCVMCGRVWGGHAGRRCFPLDASGLEPPRFDLIGPERSEGPPLARCRHRNGLALVQAGHAADTPARCGLFDLPEPLRRRIRRELNGLAAG